MHNYHMQLPDQYDQLTSTKGKLKKRIRFEGLIFNTELNAKRCKRRRTKCFMKHGKVS